MKRPGLFLSTAILAACASSPASVTRMAGEKVAFFAAAPDAPATWATKGVTGTAPQGDWIGQFNDPTMQALIEEALTANPSLEARAAAEKIQSYEALQNQLESELHRQESIEALKISVASAEGIDLKRHKLQETLNARRQLAILQENFGAAEQNLTTSQQLLASARSSRSTADEALKRLRRAWHLGQAALLAEQLEEGMPCPVCGSAEHPQPAIQSVEAVSEEQLERASEELERSEEHTSELQSRSDLVCRLLLEKKKCTYRLRTFVLSLTYRYLAILQRGK